jgi:tetratricopeptide (TPR) repeat protein
LQIEHNLGLLYQDLGQLQRAGQILKDVFAKCVERYGSQHPKTLMSRNALAVNYRLLGDSQAAYDLLSQASPELLVALGSSHPDTVITQVNLAVFLKDVGRIPEATAILQQIAQLPFEQLAESSPLRWKATNNLAVICWRQKQLDQSVPLFQQVMDWHQRFPQQSNPRDLLMAQANLGINLRDAGRASEGVEFLWAAYDGGRQFAELAWVRAALVSACESSHRDDLLWLLFWDDMAELTSPSFRGDPEIRWNEWRRILARNGDIAALQVLFSAPR